MLVQSLEPIPSVATKDESFETMRRLLDLATISLELVDAQINLGRPRYVVLSDTVLRKLGPKSRSQRRTPSVIVPRVAALHEIAAAILTVALCCPISDAGDCLANRISKCERCRCYFLSKMARPSRFCSTPCRRTVIRSVPRQQGTRSSRIVRGEIKDLATGHRDDEEASALPAHAPLQSLRLSPSRRSDSNPTPTGRVQAQPEPT